MEKLMLRELLEATGGTLLSGDEQAEKADRQETEILSVVTDSRKIIPGCVFFALSGERFDGHAYVSSALEKGAAGCIISRAPEKIRPDRFYILVKDTRRALGDLAHYYRKKHDVKVVGITGSVGKTTCREMIAAVLSRRFRIHSTKGNFNNDIGLPMTIFDLSGEDEIMVLEMGMNHTGEIRRLSEIAAPDIAVITNIGTAHIGILGSRENIFLAKKEIFDGMAPGAQAVLCGDDDFLPQIRQDPEMVAAYSIFYAGQSELCDYRAADVHVEITGTEKEGEVRMNTVCSLTFPGVKESLELCIPAAGRHLIYPASLAAAVGSLLGMTAAEIREGIGAFAGQRMPCEKYGEILIFDDTYNASPESMKSSLEVLSCVPMPRKAAVLGDMLEQGEYAEKLHRETGAAAAQAGIDTLITVGPLSSFIADEARACGLADVRAFPDRESAADAVRQITQPGTAILFKASHGMALDKLAAISRETAGK